MISHSVAVVRLGIVNSVWGDARELVGFIGFDVSLDVIVNKIEEHYSKTWNAEPAPTGVLSIKTGQEWKSSSVQQGV